MAKSFTTEDDLVKLQILNLGAKLYLTNSKQTKLLTQYILNLGKYDPSYDIRDRTRFIRQLIVPSEKSGALSKYAKKIFLAQKPAPLLESPFKDREHFQLGTLSHSLNMKATGYLELSNWPEFAPDPSVRNVEVIESAKEWTSILGKEKKEKPTEKFYSESEEEESEDSSSSSNSESESDSEQENKDNMQGSSSVDSSGSSSSEDESNRKSKAKRVARKVTRVLKSNSESTEENKVGSEKAQSSSNTESSSAEESSSESISDSESNSECKKSMSAAVPPKEENKTLQEKKDYNKHNVSLLDLDDFNPVLGPVAVPTPSVLASSLTTDLEGLSLSSSSVIDVSAPVFVPMKTHELLHPMSGKGLAAHYHFSRQPCIYNDQMVSVQVTLTNTTGQKIENIHLSEKKLPAGMRMHMFNSIESLEPGESITASMGIDFCDSTQTANFQLCTKDNQFSVNIQPRVGELLSPVTMSEKDFKKEREKLTGMNEMFNIVTVAPQNSTHLVILQKVANVANLGVVPSGEDNIHRFAAKTVHSGSLMLVTVELEEGSTARLIINTEKTVIGSILLRELKPVLSQG